MGSLKRNLLILCVAVTIATLSAHPRKRLNDQQTISLLLDKHNKFSDDNFLYRLREVRPHSNQQDQAQEELDADASTVLLEDPGRSRERRDIEEEPVGLLAARGIRRPYLPRPRPRPNFPGPRPRPILPRPRPRTLFPRRPHRPGRSV